MPRPKDQSCENCQYWFPQLTVERTPIPELPGDCRRRSPQHIPNRTTLWARVNRDEWCGQWHVIVKDD